MLCSIQATNQSRVMMLSIFIKEADYNHIQISKIKESPAQLLVRNDVMLHLIKWSGLVYMYVVKPVVRSYRTNFVLLYGISYTN